jgi:hypothetical protein
VARRVEGTVDGAGNGIVHDFGGFGGRTDRPEHPARDTGVHTADEGVEDGESLGGDVAERVDIGSAHQCSVSAQ